MSTLISSSRWPMELQKWSARLSSRPTSFSPSFSLPTPSIRSVRNSLTCPQNSAGSVSRSEAFYCCWRCSSLNRFRVSAKFLIWSVVLPCHYWRLAYQLFSTWGWLIWKDQHGNPRQFRFICESSSGKWSFSDSWPALFLLTSPSLPLPAKMEDLRPRVMFSTCNWRDWK